MSSNQKVLRKIFNVQISVKEIKKTGFNNFKSYHYSTIDDILSALNPLLQDNCLLISHTVTDHNPSGEFRQDAETASDVSKSTLINNKSRYLITEVHDVESGEVYFSKVPLIDPIYSAKSIPMQDLGGAITYARRYSLTNIFRLSSAEDLDHDYAPHSPTIQTQSPSRSPSRSRPQPKTTAPIHNNPVQQANETKVDVSTFRAKLEALSKEMGVRAFDSAVEETEERLGYKLRDLANKTQYDKDAFYNELLLLKSESLINPMEGL